MGHLAKDSSQSGTGAHDDVLELFLDLVRIDSPTREEAAVATFCAGALAGIGFSVRFDDTAERTGSDTGNLIAELPGTNDRTLVLSAHMDCVEPCRGVEPVVSDGVVTSAGDTILGADDKVGIAAIIAAVRHVVGTVRERPTLRVIFTVQEEIGLHGAKAVDPNLARGDLCLVLDAEGTPGTMIVAAPTHYTFLATFHGRSSHAGVAPEQGVSAIIMATRAIQEMQLGRLDDDTTANIGTITGGTATNVVAERVKVTGECRSLRLERVEELKAAMDRAMHDSAEAAGGTVDIDWTLEYQGFALQPQDPSVVLVSHACRDAGLTPALKRTGGGSDANVFAAHGVPTLALSCGMTNVHSCSESIRVEDVHSLVRLVRAVVERMAT